MEEQAKISFWKPALIYGAIIGFIGILVSVIFYIADLYTTRWTSWVQLLITLIVLIYCLIAYRREYLGGYASYGQIFLMVLVIGVISTILSVIYSYLLFTVIDPELIDKMKIVAEERMMSNPRIPESAYDIGMERIEKLTVGRTMMMSAIGGPVLYAIIGLIVAAFLKKEEETGEAVL